MLIISQTPYSNNCRGMSSGDSYRSRTGLSWVAATRLTARPKSHGGEEGIRTLMRLLAKQVPYLSCHSPKESFDDAGYFQTLTRAP